MVFLAPDSASRDRQPGENPKSQMKTQPPKVKGLKWVPQSREHKEYRRNITGILGPAVPIIFLLYSQGSLLTLGFGWPFSSSDGTQIQDV